MSHVDKAEDCWQWRGYLYHGYGKFRVADKLVAAHRFAYELFIGAIPLESVIDHTCHNNAGCAAGDTCKHRGCVNPAHLEAVTTAENLSRSPQWLGNKPFCKNGHEFSPERARRNGQRVCITCRRENDKLRKQRYRLEVKHGA